MRELETAARSTPRVHAKGNESFGGVCRITQTLGQRVFPNWTMYLKLDAAAVFAILPVNL